MSWTKFHRSVTKTPRLRPGGINLFPHHFLGRYRTTLAMEAQQSQAVKNFKTDSKRAAVKLWRAAVPWLPSGSSWRCRSLLRGGFWPSPERTPPCRWRRWTSRRTWWWGCRQGFRRWLPGRVAWPDIKLIVKQKIIWIFNFYVDLSLVLCTTSQYFPRPL